MAAAWMEEAHSAFDRIYALDLVFTKDCYKLCGDAHCCSFTRYKSKFVFLGNKPFQELLLLPGEWQYLEQRGLTAQFGDHEHKEYAIPLGDRYVRAETLLSRRPYCACDHDTRTTVCRLYPALPVFDLEGRFIGLEPFGIFEELERIEQLAPACQIESVPFSQLEMLLRICAEIGSSPLTLFYATAYRAAKAHVRARLADQKLKRAQQTAFAHFENAFFRSQLFDDARLGAELDVIRARFSERYGPSFDAALETLVVPAPVKNVPVPRARAVRAK